MAAFDGNRHTSRCAGARPRPLRWLPVHQPRDVVARQTYEYARYLFANKSIDIQHLFLEACGQLGIVSRPNNRYSVSVARREAVERMDAIVGPRS